jgi:hypothetical protein
VYGGFFALFGARVHQFDLIHQIGYRLYGIFFAGSSAFEKLTNIHRHREIVCADAFKMVAETRIGGTGVFAVNTNAWSRFRYLPPPLYPQSPRLFTCAPNTAGANVEIC